MNLAIIRDTEIFPSGTGTVESSMPTPFAFLPRFGCVVLFFEARVDLGRTVREAEMKSLAALFCSAGVQISIIGDCFPQSVLPGAFWVFFLDY